MSAMDVAALAELLHEAEQQHGSYEKSSPKHNWWDWYAPYIAARQNGSSTEEASVSAGRYMADVLRVLPNDAGADPAAPDHLTVES